MRALASLAALAVLTMNALSPATVSTREGSWSPLGSGGFGCQARASHGSGGEDNAREAPPKDEVWLTDADLGKLRVTTEEVKLEDVDETLVAVGPVVSASECPAKSSPERRTACVVVAIEQASLDQVHVDSVVTARTADLVHDVFPGKVAWVAGALDTSGRTVKVACLFPDPLAELRAGRQVRVEIVVGERPAFAVSRGAVVQTGEGTFVFASDGTADDGRHRFARVQIRTEGDTGGPWLPVADLQPGSIVVRSGAQTLASMLTVTAL